MTTLLEPLPLRLPPGADLRDALLQALAERGHEGAFVLAGIGSLRSGARLRLAGAAQPVALDGDLELLTLAGTLCADGPHLHASVADAAGRVRGGHVGAGCIVRTTAEVLLALTPAWRYARAFDPASGYPELRLQRR